MLLDIYCYTNVIKCIIYYYTNIIKIYNNKKSILRITNNILIINNK